MPYQRALASVLERWRAVERAIDAAQSGGLQSAATGFDLDDLYAEANRLHVEYERLVREAQAFRQTGAVMPASWNEDSIRIDVEQR